mgnify:FL=1
MTIAQARKFYEQDQREYNLEENKEFLSWFKGKIKNDYYPFIESEELQELINNITYWYEIKYPEREFELDEGIKNLDFKSITPLSKSMNIYQLMYRLSDDQLCLINGEYRSNCGGIRNIYNGGSKVVDQKAVLYIVIKQINNNYNANGINNNLIICAYPNGEVLINDDLKKYVDKERINLDELLSLFEEKYSHNLDFSVLNADVDDHNCDLELRKRILQLIALKLLYSQNTIPDRGYKRAKKFIDEFNKELNLNLSSEKIDNIINTNIEIEKSVDKKLTSSKKSRNLVKSLLKKIR